MTPHILIVDDEPSVRTLIWRFLIKHNYQVTTAATAAEAEALIGELPVDLALIDLVLPDGDGLALMRRIKNRQPHLPILIMSGIGFDEMLVKEAQDKGADGYVSKALPLGQLLKDIRRIFKQTEPKARSS